LAKVHYAEIVASVSSRSAGPGTRANIDEFTRTTARRSKKWAAQQGQGDHHPQSGRTADDHARHRVFTLSEGGDEETQSAPRWRPWCPKVQKYVPGYRLKQEVQFERFGDNNR
jgi:acetaldehyde dehydrogenase